MKTARQIYLLGDFRLDAGDGTLVVIAQARQQALLTYLLLHRQAAQPRRQLAFLLWPDSREAQALTNLRKTLTHLRQLAPCLAQVLYADHQVVQWRPAVAFTIDVAEFEEKLAQATAAEQAGHIEEAIGLWTAAVAHYTGPLTPSCYDDGLIAERERLHQLCISTLERLVNSHEHQHKLTVAITYAQQLLRLDSLHETIYLQLMRLQALQGDRAGALRTYHTCTTMLARELAVEPAPETQAAYARLLKLETGVTTLTRAHGQTRLVGRQAEWAQLQQTWRLATAQGTQVACLWGEAGIGKTHLAEALLRWAGQQGFTVAHTRAYAGEGQLAYAPVVEWLRAEPVRAVRQRLAPVWRSEVARLVPEILSEQPAIPAPDPMTEAWQRQRFWEALARALLAAPQPLLLVIDDLQWCDAETLEWLRYLLHFAPRARLLVLGMARPEEVDAAHPLQTFCRHLRSADQLTEIELGPLNAEQTAVLAAQVTQQQIDDNDQQLLFRATAGNPLFIVEMARAGLSDRRAAHKKQTRKPDLQPPVDGFPSLPPKVQAVISARLAQLSPPAHAVAHLAAVIGQDFTFDLLLQASGHEEDAFVQELDELWQRRIIREHGAYAYDFSHDRIRDGAYLEISPIRRRQLHRQVAVALEQQSAVNLDTVSSALAFHFEQAGLFAQAVYFYQEASRVAKMRYAYSEAVLYLQRGLTLLRLLPPVQTTKEQELAVLIALGYMLSTVNALAAPEVGETYRQALALCQRFGNETQLYEIQHGLRIYYGNRGEWPFSRQLAEDNLALAQVLQDPTKLQRANHGLGIVYLSIGMFSQALDYFGRSDQDKSKGLFPISLAQTALCLWLLGYPDQASQRVQEVLTLNPELPPTRLTVNLYFSLVLSHLFRNYQMMGQLAEEMLTIATKYNLGLAVVDAAVHAGFVRARLGEAELGSAQLRQALAYYSAVEERMFVPYAFAYLVEIYLEGGQINPAQAALNEALALTEQTGEHFWYAELLRFRGEALLISGAAAEAELCFQQAMQIARQQQAKSLELRAATSLARLWQQEGRSADAYQLLAETYNWFTEGFDTADLRTAKALLTELAAR